MNDRELLTGGNSVITARRLITSGITALCVALTISGFASAPALAASAPVIDSVSVSNVSSTGATLSAQINPQEAATAYRFEYGTSTAYGTSVPAPDAAVGSGSEGVLVSQAIVGLQAGTAYHYRVVATNSEGTTEGEDRVLRTYAVEPGGVDSCPNAEIRGLQSSSYLADCRAYEMVSPPEKGSANIATAPLGMTQSSESGNAIKYTSIIAYGDAAGVGPRGAEYLSRREANGWVGHSINPRQNALKLGGFQGPLANMPQYVALSPDLSKGLFLATTPVVAGHPNVEQDTNLYLRSDLFSAPPGGYELLSDSVAPLPKDNGQNAEGLTFAGASADFSHIIFETANNLTAEASTLDPTVPKLYESVNGVVRLAGILPDGTPAAESIAGKGMGSMLDGGHALRNWSENTISSDGSKVVFEAPPLQEEVFGFYDSDASGNLYMRIDGTRTIQLNLSERTPPLPEEDVTPPVKFEGASADDTKIFFTSSALMTNDPPEGIRTEGNNKYLYVYDANAPVGKHLTLISPNVYRLIAGGGISEDGSYVYFLGDSPLVAGQPEFEGLSAGVPFELYVWHDGTIHPIVQHSISHGGPPWESFWGNEGPNLPREFRITPDGRYALFVEGVPAAARAAGFDNATGNPTVCPYEEIYKTTACSEVYLYDYEADSVRCISCDPSGAAPTGRAGFEDSEDVPVATGMGYTQYLTRPLSDDGRYAFFDSPDSLVPQDTNGKRDVYEYDSQTGRLSLVSSGTSASDSNFVDASASGNDVFFTTRQTLVREDVDNSADLYDARVNGGILSQNVAPVAPCEGDDCQGPAKAPRRFRYPGR